MDPDIENLIAGMPEVDRQQLAGDMAGWADDQGIDLTEELAEQYVRDAFAADHDGYAPEEVEQVEEFEPGIAGYAARNYAQEELSSRARLAEQAAEQDAARFEQQLGRTLLERERDALEAAQRGQFQRGESVNIDAAAWTAGVKGWGEMTEDEITGTMEARIREMSGGQPDIEVPVVSGATVDDPLRPDWSQMTPDAIDQYMTMRLAGGELE